MPKTAQHIRQVIVAANRGGVGKTTSAIFAYHAMREGGRNPVLVEVERSTERVFTDLLVSAGVKKEAILHIDLPEAATYANNAIQGRRLFTNLFSILESEQDAVVDLAAGAALELLRVAVHAEHGDIVPDEGANLLLLTCCTADDKASWTGAREAVSLFKQAYPRGDAVVVINRVVGSGGGEAATRVIGKSGVRRTIEIPEQVSMAMSYLYGHTSLSPKIIVDHFFPEDKKLRQDRRRELKDLLGEKKIQVASMAEMNSDFAAFREWYHRVLLEFSEAIFEGTPAHPTSEAGDAAS